VIKKPQNEEAKARYRAVENTTTMGCNARKTNKHGEVNVSISVCVEVKGDYIEQ
jgi:hypothetical protein